jgi:hypothetical protein
MECARSWNVLLVSRRFHQFGNFEWHDFVCVVGVVGVVFCVKRCSALVIPAFFCFILLRWWLCDHILTMSGFVQVQAPHQSQS